MVKAETSKRHPKQSDDWLTPGRSRLLFAGGGACYTAAAVLSGHYYIGYPRAFKQLIDQVNPKTMIGYMRKLNLNWLITHVGKGYPPEDEQCVVDTFAAIVEEAHKYGISVIPYLSLTNIMRTRMEKLHPECVSWYAKAPDGREIPYGGASYIPGVPTPRIVACMSSPGWRKYLRNRVDCVIDANADGLYYDNVDSRCHCLRCQKDYAKFTYKEIGKRLTLRQLGRLDDKLSGGGLQVVAERCDGSLATVLEERFRLAQLTERLTDLKTYFLKKTGKSVFLCNSNNLPLVNLMPEMVLAEDSFEPGVISRKHFPALQERFPGQKIFPGLGKTLPVGQKSRCVTNAGIYKYMAADEGYDKPWFTFHHNVRNLIDDQNAMPATSWKRSIAECHAFGGNYFLLGRDFFIPCLDRPDIWPAVEKYHTFLKKYRKHWDAIYPLSQTVFAIWHIHPQIRALGELALRNYPFEVMPALQVTDERLSMRKTIVFLEDTAAAMADEKVLARFVENGGHILLLALKKTVLKNIPSKHVTVLKGISTESLVGTPQSAGLLKKTLVQLNGQPPWSVSSKKGLVCNVCTTKSKRKIMLYAVNLSNTPMKDVKITIRNIKHSKLTVTAFDPDTTGPKKLPWRLGNNGDLKFTLPQLKIYATVEMSLK